MALRRALLRVLSFAFAAYATPAPALTGADEVPFIVTPDNVTLTMLQMAKVGPDDYVIDLGSGDGRIVVTAAKRFGARGLGIEIVPELVARSRAAATAAGVSERARFREQDLFKADLSPASVITMYLLPEVNLQLRPRILQLRPGTRIVSHDWDMGEWEPEKTVVVDVPNKEVGLEKSSKVHLWIVPARIDGAWCGTGKARGTSLDITQNFQKVRLEFGDGDSKRHVEGRLNGESMRSRSGLTLAVVGKQLRAITPGAKKSAPQRATFERRRGASCK